MLVNGIILISPPRRETGRPAFRFAFTKFSTGWKPVEHLSPQITSPDHCDSLAKNQSYSTADVFAFPKYPDCVFCCLDSGKQFRDYLQTTSIDFCEVHTKSASTERFQPEKCKEHGGHNRKGRGFPLPDCLGPRGDFRQDANFTSLAGPAGSFGSDLGWEGSQLRCVLGTRDSS